MLKFQLKISNSLGLGLFHRLLGTIFSELVIDIFTQGAVYKTAPQSGNT